MTQLPPDARVSASGDPLDAVWVDRDLGWLEFNRRVLAEAVDGRTPLLEQAKFLAIFSSNLDEFFMKQMALLRDHDDPKQHGLIEEIRARLRPQLAQQSEHFRRALVPALSRHGIHLQPWDALTLAQRLEACEYFDSQVSPALTPLIIDPSQPFPFFSNLVSVAGVRAGRSYGPATRRARQGTSRTGAMDPADGRRRCGRVFVRLHQVIRERNAAGALRAGRRRRVRSRGGIGLYEPLPDSESRCASLARCPVDAGDAGATRQRFEHLPDPQPGRSAGASPLRKLRRERRALPSAPPPRTRARSRSR